MFLEVSIQSVLLDSFGAFLEHGFRLDLRFLVVLHHVVEVLLLVLDVINLIDVGRDERPFPDFEQKDIDGAIEGLEFLHVCGSFLLCGKTSANFHTKLVVFLALFGAYERYECESLAVGDDGIFIEIVGGRVHESIWLLLVLGGVCHGDVCSTGGMHFFKAA